MYAYGRQRLDTDKDWGKTLSVKVGDIQHPTVSKSPLVKTVMDSDGYRPMTHYSVIESLPGNAVVFDAAIEWTQRNSTRWWKIQRWGKASLNYGTYLPSETKVSSTQLNQLKINARNNIKDQQINVPMTLFGARSTAESIAERLQTLNKFVRDVRSGNLTRAMATMRKYWRRETNTAVRKYRYTNHKAGKPLARMWFEVNFVHMQLYNDVKGLVKEFSKQYTSQLIHGRATLMGQSPEIFETDVIERYKGTNCQIWAKGIFERKSLAFVQLTYCASSESMRRASSLGLTNIPFLIWDALPSSYIVDWVLPLGSYFQQMDATLGMEFKGGCLSKVRSLKGEFVTCESLGPRANALSTTANTVVRVPVNHRDFTRTLIDDNVSLPGFRNPLSGVAWKVATIASMVSQSISQPQRRPWR